MMKLKKSGPNKAVCKQIKKLFGENVIMHAQKNKVICIHLRVNEGTSKPEINTALHEDLQPLEEVW